MFFRDSTGQAVLVCPTDSGAMVHDTVLTVDAQPQNLTVPGEQLRGDETGAAA
jgi:hypothetical protein